MTDDNGTPVAKSRTTKNYAVYESEDPLDGQQIIPSVHIALEKFDGEPPQYLEINFNDHDPN